MNFDELELAYKNAIITKNKQVCYVQLSTTYKICIVIDFNQRLTTIDTPAGNQTYGHMIMFASILYTDPESGAALPRNIRNLNEFDQKLMKQFKNDITSLYPNCPVVGLDIIHNV